MLRVSLWDFPLYKKEPHNDIEVAKALHKVLQDFDLIIAHNQSFDLGMAKARFIYHGLPPIQFPKAFCTLAWSRRNLHLNSYSLKNVAHFFGVKEKMETSKGLWQRIHYKQDPVAQREMALYNRTDVVVTDEIHEKIAKWDSRVEPIKIKAHCQNIRCQSDNIEWRGFTSSKKRKFLCRDCLRWGSIKA